MYVYTSAIIIWKLISLELPIVILVLLLLNSSVYTSIQHATNCAAADNKILYALHDVFEYWG